MPVRKDQTGGMTRDMRVRMGKIVGMVILAMAVIVLVAALTLPYFADVNKYHRQVQSQLEKSWGRKVSLVHMDLRFLPPSLRAENAIIGEDSHFKTGYPFATADKMRVSVRFWPLLRGQIEIKALELDRPRIELVKNEKGEWNFSSLGQGHSGAGPQTPAARQLELERVLITDGQVAITDQQLHQARAVYDHIDLDVSDFAPDRQFPLKVSALLPGAVKQAVLLEGRVGPIRTDVFKTPFDGRLRLDQVPTSAAAAFLNTQALSAMEAVVSGEARIKNSGGRLDSSGTIRLDDLHVHNVSVGYPVTLDYDAVDDTNTGVIQIRRGEAKLGSTPATFEGWINTQPTPAQIDVKLTAKDAAIAEAVRLATAFGTAVSSGTDVTGQVTLNVKMWGAAGHPSFAGHVSAHNLVVNNKDFPQTTKVGAIELTLEPDAIRSNEFTATNGSTSISGKFAVAQYGTPNSTFSASLRAPKARLEEVLSLANIAGITAANGVTGEGDLSFDIRVEGPMHDRAAFLFTGKGKIRDATLNVPSLSKPMQIHHSDLTFSADSLALQGLSATTGETNVNGSLTIKGLAAPQLEFSLHADKLSVTDVQQFFALPGTEPGQAARGVAESAQANASSLLSRMNGGGTITVGTLQYDDLLLSAARSTVVLDHGVIRMNPLNAELFGGKESGNVTIDLRPAQPVYSVKISTDKVDAGKLVSSVSSLKQAVVGGLSANVDATFSSSSAEVIARSMNGDVDLNLTNAKMMNLDLLQELSTVEKFSSPLSDKSKNFTSVAQLSGGFSLKDGVAKTSNLKAVIEGGGAFTGNGEVNLAEKSLNLHMIVVLNSTRSQQAGGSRIGGFMNTAFVNNQQELVLPIILTGSLQHPQVEPDAQQVAQMKQRGLLPTTADPNEFTSAMLKEAAPSRAESHPQTAGNRKRRQKKSSAAAGQSRAAIAKK